MTAPDARSVVLARIRAALASDPLAPIEVPRNYNRSTQLESGDSARFVEALTDYRAQILIVEPAGVAQSVATLVGPRGRVAVPSDVPNEWTRGINTLVDRPETPLTVGQLDDCDAVVTGCALAIAATGTIILDAGVTQGRRVLTLVPDHHICVVFAEQIVDTVPQAFAAVKPTAPLTFISGPSATSDIELTRVEGVHGPRTLDVLLVRGH